MGLADKLVPRTLDEDDRDDLEDSDLDDSDESPQDIADAIEQSIEAPSLENTAVGVITNLVKEGVSLETIQADLLETKKKLTKEQRKAQRQKKIQLQEGNRPSYPDEDLHGSMTKAQIEGWLKDSSHSKVFVALGALNWCVEIPKKQVYRILRFRGVHPIPAIIDTSNQLIIGDWDVTTTGETM